jgi:MFS family permease
VSATTRPAFYALAPGGWRDYVTLLHPPYTAWHLSYVVLGAALAPQWRPGILGLALAAFFLGMGVAAHALDELQGRPLQTRIGRRTLLVLAVVSLIGAAAIGIAAALYTTLWLLAFVAAGAFIAVAYNLELFGGAFHGTLWFALGWGALPVLATYVAAAETIRAEALAAAVFAALVSWTQRVLSTPVRMQRRQEGALTPLGKQFELGLRLLSTAMVSLALALVLLRVT